MWITFVTTIKVLIRDKTVLMWAIAFPLVLTTLFYAMFSNLDENYKLDPFDVIIVEDEHYTDAEVFVDTIEALASSDANEGSALIIPTYVDNESEAKEALEAGEYKGYIMVDEEGKPSYTMDPRQNDRLGSPAQTIIVNVLDTYTQRSELFAELLKEDPSLFTNKDFLESLSDNAEESFTQRVSVTANPPSDSQRYFYAVLAFSTIMMSTFALTTIDALLANTSFLGARRSLGGQSKVRTILPSMAAAWLLSFICVLIGFAYLRFVFGISFGGKEPAVILTLAISTLCATFFGAFLGSLPLPSGAKSGLVAFSSCFLSLFAGLFGPFSQDLGDMVARDLPWLSACNPVRQVSEAFYSLYYYDGYEQLAGNLTNLLIFCIVFFVATTLIVRRQRYASL